MTSSKVDATHDAGLESWVESANDPASDFPIQNLPLCAFQREHDGHAHGHLGVAIGDQILDVTMLSEAGAFADDRELEYLLRMPVWAGVATMGLAGRVREKVQWFLRADSGGGQSARRLRSKSLVPREGTLLSAPVPVFNYTDFYASKHHATNVGSMFRPDNPLLPNYVHVPIGYHGRASSVVLSGSEIRRPRGQTKADDASMPVYGASKMLDYELEMGLVVAQGNEIGRPIAMEDVRRSMLGMVILNDWSARDFQKWEYQPLGPFLAKNFATTISPLVVTMEALEPFRVAGPERGSEDPLPLEYLRSSEDWGYDITVEVWIESAKMRERGEGAVKISKGNFKHMYWTLAQMLVHHASNGCNLMTGDLLGSGTISGAEKTSRGCLLELTWDGTGADGKAKPRVPVKIGGDETRTFLQDGDEVIIKAYCERPGFRRIGFGECRGRVLPALA